MTHGSLPRWPTYREMEFDPWKARFGAAPAAPASNRVRGCRLMADGGHNTADCPYAPLIGKIVSDLEEGRREARADAQATRESLSKIEIQVAAVQQSAVTGRAMWAGITAAAGLAGGAGAILIQKLVLAAPAAATGAAHVVNQAVR